jgi:hypothetical protein
MRSVPTRSHFVSSDVINTLADLKGTWPPESGYLLWYREKSSRDQHFTLEELAQAVVMTPAAELSECAVFWVYR